MNLRRGGLLSDENVKMAAVLKDDLQGFNFENF